MLPSFKERIIIPNIPDSVQFGFGHLLFLTTHYLVDRDEKDVNTYRFPYFQYCKDSYVGTKKKYPPRNRYDSATDIRAQKAIIFLL